MNRKLDKSASGSKVTFQKHLIRNPMKKNSKAVVIKEKFQVEPLILNDGESSGEPLSSRSTTKKTSFNVSDIDTSMKSLSLNPKSKPNSKINLSERDSKSSSSSDKSTKLDVPGINSSLNLSRKIDTLGRVKSAPIKSSSGKRAFDEKVTRQVNFPYEKKIFRDLMPLSSPNKQIHTVISSRDPLPPKDREPVLEDFIEQKTIQEYSYIPNFKLENRKSGTHCNNLRLYKVLQFLENC